MTVKVYYSTDASAPTLNGTAGSLINLLDAVLVNGYGSKTSLGWTKKYTGTNKAVYQVHSSASLPSSVLRVQDDGNNWLTTTASTSTFRNAIINIAENATDVDTLVNQITSSFNVNKVFYVRKSSTLDTTTRNWLVVGDERAFYLITFNTGDTSGAVFTIFVGDIITTNTNDKYCFTILGNTTELSISATSLSTNIFELKTSLSTDNFTNCLRSFDGLNKSVQLGKMTYNPIQTRVGVGGFTYPNTTDNSLIIQKVILIQSNFIRGTLPGFMNIAHNLPGANLDTFDSSDSNTYIIISNTAGSLTHQFALNLTNWRTNLL